MSQGELFVVFVVLVAVSVDSNETTRLGITNVVEIPPELLDAFLADVVDRTCERHDLLILPRAVKERDRKSVV